MMSWKLLLLSSYVAVKRFSYTFCIQFLLYQTIGQFHPVSDGLDGFESFSTFSDGLDGFATFSTFIDGSDGYATFAFSNSLCPTSICLGSSSSVTNVHMVHMAMYHCDKFSHGAQDSCNRNMWTRNVCI